jgi:mycothiol S-conjugate amidase
MPLLTLLTVHAHPDDESSKGPGTVAKYHAQGVHTVLVTCTGGEAGDILNKAMDQPGVMERLPEIRREELERAVDIIGYDELVWLGYRDSGMPDSPANADPRSFAQAPLEEAVGRLVTVIRRTRPQVIVTYRKDQAGYPHPDHLRVNEISEVAFEAAGDPDRYPWAGPAWQPLKLYYVEWSVKRMRLTHEKFLALGLESPFSEKRMARMLAAFEPPPEAHTIIEIRGFGHVMREALRAHATQVDPTLPAWFGLPPDVADEIYPFDEYQLVRNLTGSTGAEDDLFAGVAESTAVGESGGDGRRRAS